MAEDWSRAEVEATVTAYFAMLKAELRGEPYSKAEHRRALVKLLDKRSEQSVEFKHANISAVLIELGIPYISGYNLGPITSASSPRSPPSVWLSNTT